MNKDGHTSSIRDKILTINVKKGWKPGTRITFPEEGDQGPNNIPGETRLLVGPVMSLALGFCDMGKHNNSVTSVEGLTHNVC